jgi:hypothetical protein
MPKNKTRRSSATPPDRQAKVARTATSRATATPAKAAKAARTATRRTATATKAFITPLARTVSHVYPMNTSNYPYTATQATQSQYKSFVEELNRILTNEKIIDRDDKAGFKVLLAEQRPYNKVLYKINPKNIVCFVVCKNYEESHTFNKYNNHKGNAAFNELLRKNNMGMIWLKYDTLYIYRDI